MASSAEAIAPASREKGRRRRKLLAALPTNDPFAVAGLAIYLVFILIALFADVLATHDPLEILFTGDHQLAASVPPGAEHYLGTTDLGRDIYSQLVYGTRGALLVGPSAATAVVAVGTLIGLLSGYLGGWVDNVLMRLADIALGIPF